ncbi:MAG: hypothetical protein ABJA70_08020 [Chryseolinea sp.]
MKNKAVLFGMAALLMTSATFAQSVENDDMYFNSKDRVNLKAKQAQDEVAYQTAITGNYNKKKQNAQRFDEDVNPTDTYSARNENPEFAARNNSQTATSDNQDYFVSDYKYNNSTKLNNWNNSFSSWYGSPWVASNYFSPSIYGWNSPYYGSSFDSFGNPWMNPYYRSGWSSSFSFYMGNSWNYGWGSGFGMGMGMAYGSPFMNSMYGWGSPYSSFGYGYGGFGGGYGGYYGGGYYGGGYGNNVVIINNGSDGGRGVAYGKRATHGGMVTSRPESVNSRTRTSSFTDNGGVRPTSGVVGRDGSTTGRMPASNPNVSSGRNQPQADYYNRSWRGSQQTNGTSSSYSAPQRGSWSQPNNGDSWNRSGNSGNSNLNNSSFNSGRSNSSFDSGGARSHSSTGGGGGSGGRSRGRD